MFCDTLSLAIIVHKYESGVMTIGWKG